MKRQRQQHVQGFTLVEIMIVVSIISLLAVIAIPMNQRLRIDSNESAAQKSLDTYRTAMESYRSTNVNYATTLLVLGSSTPPYLDASLAAGNRRGYDFVLSNVSASTYTITASPEVPGQTGIRSFQITEEGFITVVAAPVPPVGPPCGG